MQMPLKHMDVAQEIAAEVLAVGDRTLSRFRAIWQTARSPEDRLAILAARSQLLDYLAAGHVLGDIPCCSAACEALLERADALIEHFQPSIEIVMVELSLAITAKRPLLVRTLATAISGGKVIGGQTLESYQARSLAALLNRDYSAALTLAATLADASQSKTFDKLSSTQGLFWATAVQRLAGGDGTAAVSAVQEIQHLHIRSTEKELGKLKRGGASAFAPFDMLDLPAAALVSLIETEEAYTGEPV